MSKIAAKLLLLSNQTTMAMHHNTDQPGTQPFHPPRSDGIVKADVIERGELTGRMGALGWRGWLQLHPDEQQRYWSMGKDPEY